MAETRAVVIGCGVSGLTCGVLLAEAGLPVSILARDLPPRTTSNVAAAIWQPYKAYPIEKVTEWGRRTLETFTELARVPGTGVFLIEASEVRREKLPDPVWMHAVRGFHRLGPRELPEGYVDGYAYQTTVMEMEVYLDYLINRFRGLGGEITRREVASLEEVAGPDVVVVNCTGLAARTLVGDTSLFPIRGQVVRVPRPASVNRAYLDDDETYGTTYIVPRSNDCILGGTAQVGNWSLEVDPATAEAIMERCARLEPDLRGSEILEHRVGLRPARPSVRLEAERLPGGGLVVHDYGHGGAGVTLSWGCAADVVELVQRETH